jgi:hypothetical protein
MRSRALTAAALFAAVMMLTAFPGRAGAAPTISSFTPAKAALGSVVTITGSGFTGATSVKFLGVAAANISVVSSTSIHATVPTLARSGKISVTAPGGVASSATIFTVLPGIALTPVAGPPSSAPAVSGSGFGANEFVDIYEGVRDTVLAVTDLYGTFSGMTLPVPASAPPGTLWISAKGEHSQLAAQKAFTVRTDWVNPRRNAGSSGWNPYETVLDYSTVGRLEWTWSTSGGNYFANVSPAVVVASGLIVGESAHFGTLTAVRTDGSQAWSQPFSSSFFSGPGPAEANGILVTASSDGKVHAYTLATGARRWTSAGPSDTGAGSLVVWNSTVFAPGATAIRAFNLTTGAPLWSYSGSCANTFSTPAVAAGIVVFSCRDSGGNPLQVDLSTGGAFIGSAFAGGTGTTSAPAVVGGNVYSLFGGVLESRSLSGFYPKFSVTPPFSVFADPAAGDSLVATCGAGGIWVVYAGDGSTRFSNPNYPCNAPVTIANGVIYEPQGGDIAMFDEYGNLLGRLGAGGAVGPIAIVDGSVYAAESITGIDRWTIPAAASPAAHLSAARPDVSKLQPNRKLKPNFGTICVRLAAHGSDAEKMCVAKSRRS